MKTILFSGIVLAASALMSPAFAGTIAATGVLSSTPDGSNFDYTIKLTNTSGAGGDNVGTFWFSWVPGQGYLPSLPANIVAPAGWAEKITDGPPPTDGYSIQFVAGSGSALTPGNSLSFTFVSPDSPSTLAGLSAIHPPTPILTSTLYEGGPFTGDTAQFQVSSVPEPSSLILGVFGILASFAYTRIKRASKAPATV